VVGVTALVVTWVTAGLVHLPPEASLLGWRFTLYRTLVAFIASLIIAFLIPALLHVLG